MCDTETINGVMRDGGFGEYVYIRSEAAVSVPHGVDPAKYAPLLCAGVTVFNGLRQQNITSGDIVAVQGLGGLGHLALQYARKMGFRTVAISSSASKKEFASKLGAHDYVDGSKGDVGQQLKVSHGTDCTQTGLTKSSLETWRRFSHYSHCTCCRPHPLVAARSWPTWQAHHSRCAAHTSGAAPRDDDSLRQQHHSMALRSRSGHGGSHQVCRGPRHRMHDREV
jgi:threonine dehydrogenase-like Zn-dependent dehydrogenase